ncbi:DUF968 domain-containing protein [Rahnella inusitata]|uniref:DUF968 domain-containing protein n=1 Tax=Rahnella inusitata TaxID=58169 RepID=A0ABX9P0G6_9GAMM|nr:DUF968 domain-containing protein [Rahnella inusitata]
MRALLKPYPQKDLGIVLLRPPADMLQHFSGKRLLITDEPADLRNAPEGLVLPEVQPIAKHPLISSFLASEPVLYAAGGWEEMTNWVKHNRGCHCSDHAGYHHHEMTHARRKRGVISLCWYHDTQLRNKESVDLDDLALANTMEFVTERIRRWLGEPVGHKISLGELCWWAIGKGIADKLPQKIISEAMGIPYDVPGGQRKEADVNPWAKQPGEVLAENIKPVLALAIDPETPESYLLRPKRRRYENTKYTQWVKRQPCCACGNGSDDPHHIAGNGFGGMATKAHDLFVIPLCRRCHDSLHANTQDWEAEHGTQEHLLLTTLDRALAMGVIATGKVK